MFEDLAQTSLAVYFFVLAGFALTWALSPVSAAWEIARLRMSPRSFEDRVTSQSLVGPVILLGAVGFIISGTVGWSVGALMDGINPLRFDESSLHINVILVSIGVFAVAAYLTNSYARYGSGRPTNLGERLHELQQGDRGFYAAQHMDENHWLALRAQVISPWDRIRKGDGPLIGELLATAPGKEPWDQVNYQQVLQLRTARGEAPVTPVERRLARRLWIYHPTHWFRIALLGLTLGAAIIFAVDSHDQGTIIATLIGLGVGLLVIPPLLLRASRSSNRARTATLARDLLWTKRAVNLIDAQLEQLRSPPADAPRYDQPHLPWSVLGRIAVAKLTGITPGTQKRPGNPAGLR